MLFVSPDERGVFRDELFVGHRGLDVGVEASQRPVARTWRTIGSEWGTTHRRVGGGRGWITIRRGSGQRITSFADLTGR